MKKRKHKKTPFHVYSLFSNSKNSKQATEPSFGKAGKRKKSDKLKFYLQDGILIWRVSHITATFKSATAKQS